DQAVVPRPGQAQPFPPPPDLVAHGDLRRGVRLDQLGRHRRARRRRHVARSHAGRVRCGRDDRRAVDEPATLIAVIPGPERSSRTRDPFFPIGMDSGPAPSARPGMTTESHAGITGSSTYGILPGAKCSVLVPPKIAGGRSCGLVWVNGPTPFISYGACGGAALVPSYS